MLVCQDCGQDQREPTENDHGIDMGPDDADPEESWTPEQHKTWAAGERAEREMIERMKRGEDH